VVERVTGVKVEDQYPEKNWKEKETV